MSKNEINKNVSNKNVSNKNENIKTISNKKDENNKTISNLKKDENNKTILNNESNNIDYINTIPKKSFHALGDYKKKMSHDSSLNVFDNKIKQDNSLTHFDNYSLNSSISSQNLLTQSRQVRANFISSHQKERGKVISKSRSPIDLYSSNVTFKHDLIRGDKIIKRSASERVQGEKNRTNSIQLISEKYNHNLSRQAESPILEVKKQNYNYTNDNDSSLS